MLRKREFHRESPERSVTAGQLEREAWDYRDNAPSRKQFVAQMKGCRLDREPRKCEPTDTKGFGDEQAEITDRRLQRPRLVRQLGKLDLAPAGQGILRSRRHNQ